MQLPVINGGQKRFFRQRILLAEQAPIQKLGEISVFFLPYLMGERSPHNNPDARGVFFGMSMDTTRADMTQAVLEGVAFGLRDSLEVASNLGIKIERTKICGGGAKSPLWKKIIAIFGCKSRVYTAVMFEVCKRYSRGGHNLVLKRINRMVIVLNVK